MPFVTSRKLDAILAVWLAAFITASLVTAPMGRGTPHPMSHCPRGECDDAGDVSYMHLLQITSDRRLAAQSGVEPTQKTLAAIKKVRPYYHTTQEIREEVELLSKSCNGAMTVETHSDSIDRGVTIDVIRLRAPDAQPLNKVFLLFGEHSRELISPESGLHFLKIVCGKVPIEGKLKIPNILLENEFQIVLNGNPHSRVEVERGDFCLRTNPNGVDLNRNWDEMWEEGESDSMSDTNAGPKPFSEPETRIFKRLVEHFQPTTFLTVHSGTRGMYMPWAYDMKHTARFNAPLMLNVLKDLDKAHCQCPYGAAGKEVGYPCPGTCLDWVYSKLKTPYVFAFEIYTSSDRDEDLKKRWDEKAASGGLKLLQSGSHLGHEHFQGLFDTITSDFVHTRARDAKSDDDRQKEECFSQFNPGTEATYNATVQNWAVAYLEMAAMIAEQLKKDNSILHSMKSQHA
jgi:hypothetical protein